jgi:hypothetical protein
MYGVYLANMERKMLRLYEMFFGMNQQTTEYRQDFRVIWFLEKN